MVVGVHGIPNKLLTTLRSREEKSVCALVQLWVPTELIWLGARTKWECLWGHLKF